MKLSKNEKQTIIQNRKLCKRYPFLIPRSRITGKIFNNYDYSGTELDNMEPGWIKAFGLLMCEELRNLLIKCNYLNDYRISEIKEKHAQLRWYDFGVPKSIYEEFKNVIWKYEYISSFVCQKCGKFDVPTLIDGWSMVICKDCYEKWREKIDWMIPYSETKKETKEIKDYITITTYSKELEVEVERIMDISKTLNKIRGEFYVKI